MPWPGANFDWAWWRGYELAASRGQGDAYLAGGQNFQAPTPEQDAFITEARQLAESGQWQNPGVNPPPGAQPAAAPAPAPAAPAAPAGPPPAPVAPQPPPQAAPTPLPTAPGGIVSPLPSGGYTRVINTPSGPATFWLPAGDVPGDIAAYYLRSDTPGGLSTETPPPEVVDKFRRWVASGNLVPLDAAAKGYVQSQGGLLPGDIPAGPPGINAPIIGGQPGGLGIEWWQTAFQNAQRQAQQALEDAVAKGFFGANPPRIDPATGQYDLNDPNLTLQARSTIAGIIDQATRTTIQRDLAQNTIYQTQAETTGFVPGTQGAPGVSGAAPGAAGAPTLARERYLTEATGFVGGTPGGQATLERERFTAEEQARAYQRAAAPARSFEYALARGAGFPQLAPGAAQLQFGGQRFTTLGPEQLAGTAQAVGIASPQYGSQYGQYGATTGAQPILGVTPEQQLRQRTIEVPGVVEAFRQGQGYATAGQLGVPSTTRSVEEASLGPTAFQQQNLSQTTRMSPTEQMIVGSFGQAGGVSPEEQAFWKQQGLRKTQGADNVGSYAI